uniref:EF-hand domain-containing protein n=1 Tax=Alexandrium monilatum TaxID=311494 RepID=A0A7S4QQC8_9DINO
MITAGGDNLEEVQQAVTETEIAAKAAQSAIGEARIYLNAKQAAVKRYESDKVRTMAATELAKLQQQLQEAQNKLNPLKVVRQDFLQRQAAKKVADEILELLTPAELDCDRAEEASNLLAGVGLSKELLQQAELALKRAADQVAHCGKVVAQKKAQATDVVLAEIEKCEDRIKTAEGRLAQLRNNHKEAAERVTCDTLLKEATEKLQAVQEAVSRAADAEGPFLMGVEELPLEETMGTVKACETAATAANTQASVCRMFVATKLVEAKRFSPKPSQETQARLRDLQKQLESYVRKLGDLKKATAERKAKALMRGAESYVAEAEVLTKRMAEAASIFEDDNKLCEASSAEIRAAADETQKAEQVAVAAIVEARKFITQRQIESKGRDASVEVSAELIKYQTRVSTAQTEVARWRKLASTCEQRLAAKRAVEEAKGKVASAEESVKQVSEMVKALDGEESGGEDAVKAAETAANECQATVKTMVRYLETQSRAQNAARDELAKLQTSMKEIQEQLEHSLAAMRTRAEQQVVKGLVAESEARVVEAEESVRKVSDAEAPFLIDGDVPSEQAVAALTELENSAAAAHTVVGGTKTFIAMKRLAARRLSESATTACNKDLDNLQARLDGLSKKLTDIRKGMSERKHTKVKREVMAKITDLEQLVEAAKEATKSLVDGGADTKEVDNKAAREKAAAAQSKAVATLDTTRKLAVQRQQDVKASSTDAAALTDLTKMLDQLNRFQQELDRQQGLLRDQEHRFVATRLLSEAIAEVEGLEKRMEALGQLATPLVADQKDDLLASVWLEEIIDALRRHMALKALSKEDMFRAMGGQDGRLNEAKFTGFITEFPALCEQQDSLFTQDELKAAFKRAGGEAAGDLTLEQFCEHFRRRFVVTATVSMTDNIAIKGGKTLRKVDPNEIMEALEEPAQDEVLGIVRVRAKAESDGKEGYVTISGNRGTVYLKPYSAHTALEKKVEQSLQELTEAINDAFKHVDKKVDELRTAKAGPLVEAKAELSKCRPRVTKVQYIQSALKKKVAEAQKKLTAGIDAERKRRQEVVERRSAQSMIDENTAAVNSLEERVGKCVPTAEALVKSCGADQESPAAAMEAAERELQATLEAVDKGHTRLKVHLDQIKASMKGPFSEARSALVKLKVRLGSFESRCQKQVAAIKAARSKLEAAA